MSSIFPPTRALLAFAFFGLLLVGIAFGTGAYFRSLNPDEAEHYAPSIAFVSRSLPHLPLRDYPFPAPPLALWVQAAVATVFDGLTSVRVFSTVCTVFLAAWLLGRVESRARLPTLGALAILTFPFLLWNTFTIKQHAWTVALLLVGLECWSQAEEDSSKKERLISSGFLLTAATLSNQFCAPLCAALAADSLRHTRTLSKPGKMALLAAVVPLLCLGLLMIYWGGKQPPSYVDPLPALMTVDWHRHLAQFALGLISIGAWVGALSFAWRSHGKAFLLALLPCSLLVWVSHLYSISGDFWTTAQGPVSRMLFGLSHLPLLLIFIAGALAALAVAFWFSPMVGPRWNERCRYLILIYLAIAAAAVPFLFESYYLLLILPLLLILTMKNPALSTDRWRVHLHFAAMIVAGVGYSVFKLRQFE
jgi:4-amino-4-deoxy-L-arabinose transferase-like glycosyltransferase